MLNFLVLKAALPLTVSEESLEAFTRDLADVLEAVHSSKRLWQNALELASRALEV